MAEMGMARDECAGRLYGGSIIEHYELTRTYTPINEGRTAIIGPAGETLNVKFCSAKCLCRYVETHIAPEAASE